MKSLLYAAATLMIGASIYGFVDYNKTKDQKKFAGMYDEKENTSPAVVNEQKPYGDVVQTGSNDGFGVANDNNKPKEEKVKEEGSIVKSLVKKFKKKRKVDFESFSRAPLREEQEIMEGPAPKEKIKKEQ
ncbi:MAG: hypothetical protein JNN00_17235 [Chitinophagaceae bacterium]|nr:hypothetical protein [Chitinophagaceae bacterium]